MTANRLLDYLDAMQRAASDARDFADGLSKADFLADKRTQQAVSMSFVILGEAATKILADYPAFTTAHTQIPWRSIRGMRNRVAHGYFEVDFNIVWETIQSWLPGLIQQMEAARQDARNGVL